MRIAELGLIMLAKVKDKLNICGGVEKFEDGIREFAIYDNNGYLLQFGQEIGV